MVRKGPLVRRRVKISWVLIKSWLPVVGSWTAGLLPCPDCGAPMIMHFWPLALVLTLRKLREERSIKSNSSYGESGMEKSDQ